MPSLIQKALSNPSSQPLDKGGLDSASTLTTNTVPAPSEKRKEKMRPDGLLVLGKGGRGGQPRRGCDSQSCALSWSPSTTLIAARQ
jgi:hypothetical protein